MRETISFYEVMTGIFAACVCFLPAFEIFQAHGNIHTIFACGVMIFFTASFYLSSHRTLRKLGSLDAGSDSDLVADLRITVAKLSMGAMMMGLLAWVFAYTIAHRS